jgi:hypothetical protein
MPRIASAQVKRRLNHESTSMDPNKKNDAAINALFGFVFIRVQLSRRSLGEGGFVVKMDIFAS